uniref:choice-of-anchor L domain-containing protein n=1 Tax=Flavobacterium sp. TaxID=239 RepID=UPI003342692F
MKKIFILFALLSIHVVQSQLVVNNTAFPIPNTPAWLVQNVLLGPGVTVSNITFNGSPDAANTVQDKVGKFSNGNASNLGLISGIILATGNATAAVGPNNSGNFTFASSSTSPNDSDLDLLTTNTINNKTIIEFDFIPNGNNLQFKFVFASEEYPEYVNSSFNDVFGFFLSGPGINGPYSNNAKNIALIPSTNTPITINNVNANSNSAYFTTNVTGGNTIQYDGFTKVIAAVSNVQCGLTYHIKLAIANVGDNSLDSAVFLEAGSFNVTPPLTLPMDLLVSNGLAPCYSTSAQVCSGLPNTVVHEWKLNGVVIPGQTGPCVTVNQPGQLCATVYPFGPNCPFTDCMTVEFLNPMPLGNPVNLSTCIGGTFNLSSNSPIILGGLSPTDYVIDYYNSQADAENSTSPITNITTYPGTPGEVIWVGIIDNVTGAPCVETKSFTLNFVSTVTPTITCGTPTGSSVNFNWLALSGATDHSVSYQVNSGPANTIGLIGNVNNYQVSGLSSGDNVQITITPIGGAGTCFGPATFSCTAASCPSITSPSSAQSLCFFGDPTPFSVSTNFTGSNAISYVYFTSPQTGNNMYIGGIPLGFSTPNTSGTATLDLPANGTLGSLPNTPGIYYVYAIANPAPADITCRPFAEIQVTVNAIPALPTVTTLVNYCQGETASQLTAVGTGLLWYTTPTGGTGSATAPTPSTAAAAVGTTLYYVSQTISGCEGPRSPISVTVNATPALPTVTSPVTYCQNDSATALSATGTGLLWYTTPTGGAGSATAPTPSTA